MAESGFDDATGRIRSAWERGDREGASAAVPDAMIDATCVVGTETTIRGKVASYRAAGITLPLLSYRGPDLDAGLETVRAAAPLDTECPEP